MTLHFTSQLVSCSRIMIPTRGKIRRATSNPAYRATL